MKLSEYDTDRTYEAQVVSSERITDESTAEVRHILLRVSDPMFQFIEGQSIAVLVPGPHAFGNEYHIRLYSIASSRFGEDDSGAELSICVRRCSYVDEVSGERYPGVASTYLCDRSAGDSIEIAGPYGKHPERRPVTVDEYILAPAHPIHDRPTALERQHGSVVRVRGPHDRDGELLVPIRAHQALFTRDLVA